MCYRKAKNIVEFHSLSLASGISFSQELSIGRSRLRVSQQVGESPSSQQAKKKSYNRENVQSGRMNLFSSLGDQQHDRKLPQFTSIAPKNSTTATRRLSQFLQVLTVYKENMSKVYYSIARCVNGFVSWRVQGQ